MAQDNGTLTIIIDAKTGECLDELIGLLSDPSYGWTWTGSFYLDTKTGKLYRSYTEFAFSGDYSPPKEDRCVEHGWYKENGKWYPVI